MQVNLKNDDSARETLSLIRKSLKSDNYSEIEKIKNGIGVRIDPDVGLLLGLHGSYPEQRIR